MTNYLHHFICIGLFGHYLLDFYCDFFIGHWGHGHPKCGRLVMARMLHFACTPDIQQKDISNWTFKGIPKSFNPFEKDI